MYFALLPGTLVFCPPRWRYLQVGYVGYGTNIKTNYVFCTVCTHLFLNEKELKKHKVKCNICEVCGRDSHKGVCLSKNLKSNNEKKKKENK